MRAPAEGASESGGKGRSNKIRREDGWDETPKPTKKGKKKTKEIHVDEDEDAFVGADFVSDQEGELWDDES
jgi:hypothetical protein